MKKIFVVVFYLCYELSLGRHSGREVNQQPVYTPVVGVTGDNMVVNDHLWHHYDSRNGWHFCHFTGDKNEI